MTSLFYSHPRVPFNSEVQVRSLPDDPAPPVFTDTEQKLLRLGLDPAAHPGEVANCGSKLLQSLHRRGVSADKIILAFAKSTAAARDLVAAKRYQMTFGKHRGRPLSEIPPGYLRWVLLKCDNATPDLKRAISIVLNEQSKA